MCGIDPSELAPFQGGPFIGRFPGLKPRLNPVVPSGRRTIEKRPYLSAILPVCGR
jgi:hypothetical protein